MSVNKIWIVDASSGDINHTLPSAKGAGSELVIIKKIDGTLNKIVVDTIDGETIDGELFVEITSQNTALSFVSDSQNWFIV